MRLSYRLLIVFFFVSFVHFFPLICVKFRLNKISERKFNLNGWNKKFRVYNYTNIPPLISEMFRRKRHTIARTSGVEKSKIRREKGGGRGLVNESRYTRAI